ncbi:MAG: thiamine pyrophosphokinase [Pedobacter sp.]
MSSHHIVREKQEPALYIHHLGNFDEEYLGQLLEWSPSLVVNSSEFEKVISLGLKVDIVVNPEDSIIFQENTKSINTDNSDMKSVLEYLISEGYPAVNLIDSDGEFESFKEYISQINIVLFTGNYKAYAIKSGFKVWKPSGTIFTIADGQEFTYQNLEPLEPGVYEVAHDGFVEFLFSPSYLFISETL